MQTESNNACIFDTYQTKAYENIFECICLDASWPFAMAKAFTPIKTWMFVISISGPTTEKEWKNWKIYI